MRLSDSEWTAMTALWAKAPATAREVHGRVEPETSWSYSTVRTILARLVDKGAVASEPQGQQSIYRPLVSRDAARRSALSSLVDRAFGGRMGSLVQHLAEERDLDPATRDALEKLVEDAETEDRP